MHLYLKSALGCFMIVVLSHSLLFSESIILENSEGETYKIEVDPAHSFKEVVHSISECVQIAETEAIKPQPFQMTISQGPITVKSFKAVQGISRNFYEDLTFQDQADIFYIITTLADASLLKVKNSESSLKAAGARIDKVHPLRFSMFVFTNDQLKVAMYNLQGRAWIWKEFISGITRSLKEEHAINNIMPFIQQFIETVKVDSSIIMPIAQAGKWEKFIEALIKYAPRQGGASNRYDM